MENDIPVYVINNMIFIIRKNLNKFEKEFDEISSQLYKIEKMRLAKIREKFILKSLIEDNSIIIQSLGKLNDDKIVKKIKNKIKKFEKELI